MRRYAASTAIVAAALLAGVLPVAARHAGFGGPAGAPAGNPPDRAAGLVDAPTEPPPTAAHDVAGAEASPDGDAREHRDRERPQAHRETYSLECRGLEHQGEAAIECRWSPPSRHPAFAAYELWRHRHPEPDPERTLVLRTEDRSRLSHRDTDVESRQGYMYLLRSVDADGNTIGSSNLTRTMPGEPPHERPDRAEDLSLACREVRQDDEFAIACRWEPSGQPRFARYELWRGQHTGDGGWRTKVFETHDRDRTSYVDEDVESNEAYAYMLLVIDEEGKVVGRGGPAWVGTPAGRESRGPAGFPRHGHGGRAG